MTFLCQVQPNKYLHSENFSVDFDFFSWKFVFFLWNECKIERLLMLKLKIYYMKDLTKNKEQADINIVSTKILRDKSVRLPLFAYFVASPACF